jgi:hypothetical protein
MVNDPTQAARQALYQASPKGRATQQRWQSSPEGRLSRRGTYSSHKLSYKIRASRALAIKHGHVPVDPTTVRPYPEDGRCELCQNVRWQSLCLDHDHRTGKFRGWICTRCNAALGLIGDTVESLQLAISYLVSSLTSEP